MEQINWAFHGYNRTELLMNRIELLMMLVPTFQRGYTIPSVLHKFFYPTF